MSKGGYKWTPLQRANSFKKHREEIVTYVMAEYTLTREAALQKLAKEDSTEEVYVNDIYQVAVSRHAGTGGMVHINIRRRDGGPILRDWRHFQQIKNEILGPECEAIELYPAESRKVDEANKYHLYGVPDPSFRFPVGWDERRVEYAERRDVPGMRQRPQSMRIPEEAKPVTTDKGLDCNG